MEPKKWYKAPVHHLQLRDPWDSRGGDKRPVYLCPTFKSMNTESKTSYVKSNHLCFNCLPAGHHTKECRSSGRCHTSFHREVGTNSPAEVSAVHPVAEQPTEPATVNAISPITKFEPSLQMTSQVVIESPEGKQLLAPSLLDPGISLITRRVVEQLQLHKRPHQLSIRGDQGVATRNSQHSVTFLPSRQSRMFSLYYHSQQQ